MMFAAVSADEYSDRGELLLLIILGVIFVGYIITSRRGPKG